MPTNALVLGAGMVGSVIATDLASTRGWRVSVADRSDQSLERMRDRAARLKRRVRCVEEDLSDAAVIARLAADADIVVGALPSALGFAALQAVIDAKRPYVDISFMPEDPLELDAVAKRRRVTAVVDCGVAPGMSNLLAGWAARHLDECRSISIVVGGVPEIRQQPFEYKAAFAPSDVLEEYTRPARLVEGGEVVTRDALSEVELVDLPGVDTLEAFNTDGLRSLVHTLDVPFMKEKTLRYPGHAALMRAFRSAGFLDPVPTAVGDVTVSPLAVTSNLLFPAWEYGPGEADLTVMRVEAEGTLHGAPARVVFDLLDRYDPETATSSMARTTGFPCAVMARLVAEGVVRRRGVSPPELLAGEKGLLDRMLGDLARRGVRYEITVEGSGSLPKRRRRRSR